MAKQAVIDDLLTRADLRGDWHRLIRRLEGAGVTVRFSEEPIFLFTTGEGSSLVFGELPEAVSPDNPVLSQARYFTQADGDRAPSNRTIRALIAAAGRSGLI